METLKKGLSTGCVPIAASAYLDRHGFIVKQRLCVNSALIKKARQQVDHAMYWPKGPFSSVSIVSTVNMK